MKKLITMLSALTITSTVVPTVVACNNKEEQVVLDLNALTSDMILNFDESYYYNVDSTTSKLDTLTNLSDFAIKFWLTERVSKIFTLKLVGLSKTKWEKMNKNKNTKEILKFMEKTLNVAMFLLYQNIAFNVDSKKEDGSTKYILNITIKKWDDVKMPSQNLDSMKEMYDSIKGKENGKVTVSIDFDAIKAMYDKQ